MNIADFYDQHPYPPPPVDLHDYAERWRDPSRLRANFHLLFPWRRYRAQRSILVAGCGTAQAARYAIRHPEAKVVGIDVSRSSLGEEQRLKELHDLDNLELRELAIENAADLGATFDEVVSTGVLHHLDDPGTGLRALRSVLAPGGLAHLMVYARYGRTGVAMIAEYATRIGVAASREEIVALAQTLAEIPHGHPIEHLLRESPDFRRVDALADALLNPREVAYSVPELMTWLDDAGWQLSRWYRQAPYLASCGTIASTPHGERLAALPVEHQYEAMELFRGTFTTHSVVSGAAASTPTSDDPLRIGDWRELVPLRVPGALTITERTPPGAAAILLNEEHTFTDLVLPIDQREKALVDTIDGERAIGELTFPDEATRAFFQRLWRWDQVVFDGSRTSNATAL